MEGLGLDPVLRLGVLEERVEVGTEQIGERLAAGQGVSEVAATIPTMSSVIDFAAWRRRRPGGGQPEAHETDPEDPTVVRLELAIQRLHRVISLALDARGRLEPKVETELLA